MKHFISTLLLCFLCIHLSAEKLPLPRMYAHRGCWTKAPNGEFIVPENSLAAVAMAKKMKYEGIECDVHYTKDKVMVILHDATINRTMRLARDYSPIEKQIKLSDLTFQELRENYVLASEDPTMRTPIPTLQELLTECKKHGLKPMLHSSLAESYRVAQAMFGDEWICFTGSEKEILNVREYSNCMALLSIDGGTAEETIRRLEGIGGHCGISTMKYKLLTKDFCHKLKQGGYEVQASIFPMPWEMIGQSNGITMQLTDYSYMPVRKQKPRYTLDLRKQPSFPTETLSCGAFVLELKIEGEAEVVIDGKHTYPISSDGKEEIRIGHRFFNRSLPNVQLKGTGYKLKKAKLKVFAL